MDKPSGMGLSSYTTSLIPRRTKDLFSDMVVGMLGDRQRERAEEYIN